MERVEMRDKTNRSNPKIETPANSGKKSHKYPPSNKEMGSPGPTGIPGPSGINGFRDVSSGSVKIGKTTKKVKSWDTSLKKFDDFF